MAKRSTTSQDGITKLRRRILAWYRAKRRDLPWRRTGEPYPIWVSEIMLQQTRVDAVLPYYERFLRRFPDVESLARAKDAEVLQAWAGLGYYSRARNLHAAARCVVQQHEGRIPEDSTMLERLPGIGRYTSGAIRSIAFGQRAPVLDGNVIRVLTRLLGIEDDPERPATRKRLWTLAERWAACRSPGDANQALMELGALVCTKPVPHCTLCPVEKDCVARSSGLEMELPRPRKRPARRRVSLALGVLRRGTRFLLVRRLSGRLLHEWWELPGTMYDRGTAPDDRLANRLRRRFGIRATGLYPVASVRHGILNQDLEVQILVATRCGPGVRKARPQDPDPAPQRGTPIANLDLAHLESRWVEPTECRRLALSTLTRKALHLVTEIDSGELENLGAAPTQEPGNERRRRPSR